ncbi:MAG: 16S rRNA processing protein RimM [Rikenellaceae bacterium]|nr:16S rRNA processing protein RimM [Rikenellaceae bacterium]MDE7133740.1 16S rRNA processing protein RimM [Rikenellaceae bacterium]MDE7356606.1 16S rRNA processing protein RimM [Rikenellaceae bacterium]
MEREYSKEVIAKVTKLFGGEGLLSLKLSAYFPDQVNIEEPWFVEIDGLEVPLFISSFKPTGNAKAVVSFDDLDNDRRASELIGRDIYIYAEPDIDDELYWEDMEGYTLIDLVSGMSGTIEGFRDYTDNPLVEVDFSGVEVLVPVSDEIIVSVDDRARIVEANLPEGLINLYSDNDYDQ